MSPGSAETPDHEIDMNLQIPGAAHFIQKLHLVLFIAEKAQKVIMSSQLCGPSAGECPDRLKCSVIQTAWLQPRKAQKSLEIQTEVSTLHPLCCCSVNGFWTQHRQRVQQLRDLLSARGIPGWLLASKFPCPCNSLCYTKWYTKVSLT